MHHDRVGHSASWWKVRPVENMLRLSLSSPTDRANECRYTTSEPTRREFRTFLQFSFCYFRLILARSSDTCSLIRSRIERQTCCAWICRSINAGEVMIVSFAVIVSVYEFDLTVTSPIFNSSLAALTAFLFSPRETRTSPLPCLLSVFDGIKWTGSDRL